MSEDSLEEKIPKPLQIFTLARAVRPAKKSFNFSNEKSDTCNEPVKSTISAQIEKTLKIKHETNVRRQPKSGLPLGMIVSKMVTRNPISDESKDAQDDLNTSVNRDFSMVPPSLRKKLTPPSWQNKLKRTKRPHTTEMQEMINEMKRKCTLDALSFFDDSRMLGRDPKHPLSVSNIKDTDHVVSTPRLRYNYNQLYRARKDQDPPLTCEGEDPIGVESGMPAVKQEMSEEQFKFDPTYSTVRQEENTEPEFVWNPVIVCNQPERLPSPFYETMDTSTYHCGYEYKSDPPYYHTDHIFNENFGPHSPRNWESSSDSSAQTIAEERLQLTLYATRGRGPLYKSGVVRDNLSWSSPESTEDSESLWAFRKFLEE